MHNSIITVARLEELTREGDAIKVVDRITHRVYEWRTTRYFCDFADAASGRDWIVVKTEPKAVHTPEPPSILQRIVNIVDAGRTIASDGEARDVQRDLQAFGEIVALLKSEGLLA